MKFQLKVKKRDTFKSVSFGSYLLMYALIFIVKAVIGAGGRLAVSKALDIVLVDVDRTDVGVGIFVIIVKFTAFAGAEFLRLLLRALIHVLPSLSFWLYALSLLYAIPKSLSRRKMYFTFWGKCGKI